MRRGPFDRREALLICVPVAEGRVNEGRVEPTWIAVLVSKDATMSALALRIAELSEMGRALIQL